jgi:hypothetical protein
VASNVFSDGRWTAHKIDLCLSANAPSPAQHQNIFAELANSIVELWRATLAGFMSLSQIAEFKSKTLYARLCQEAGGPLDTKQIGELEVAAEQRTAQLARSRYQPSPSGQFREPFCRFQFRIANCKIA